jgi:hypothetical protein
MRVNAQGLCDWMEIFADDKLADALARLYARYADDLPAGPARERAVATARSVATLLGPFDPDRVHETMSADVEFVDHRILGLETGRGIEGFRRNMRAMVELADEIVLRIDDVLALRSDMVLLRRTRSGQRAGGGAFEQPLITLWVFGSDGLVMRAEQFDVDRADEALARLGLFDADQRGEALARSDELMAAAPPRFTNAAVRAVERFTERWLARDWDGAMATFAPVPWLDDRRRLIRLQLSGADYFAHARLMFATR